MLLTVLVDNRWVLTPDLLTVRSFNWGLLFLSDHQAYDPPSSWPTQQATVAVSTETTMVIAVRHSADTEDDAPARVQVQVFLGTEAAKPIASTATLRIDSGRLEIGDPAGREVLSVEPGSWRVEVSVEPIEHPERVAIWATRLCG